MKFIKKTEGRSETMVKAMKDDKEWKIIFFLLKSIICHYSSSSLIHLLTHWLLLSSRKMCIVSRRNVDAKEWVLCAFMFIVQFKFNAVRLVCTFLMFYANASISFSLVSLSSSFFLLLLCVFWFNKLFTLLAKVHSM